MQLPVTTLRNGVRVANFFEERPLVLDTGEVLPACDPHWLRECQSCVKEIIYDYHPWVDVQLKPYLALPVRQMFFQIDWEEVDIVLVTEFVRRAIVEEYKTQRIEAPAWLDAAYKKTRLALRSQADGVVCSTKFLM